MGGDSFRVRSIWEPRRDCKICRTERREDKGPFDRDVSEVIRLALGISCGAAISELVEYFHTIRFNGVGNP